MTAHAILSASSSGRWLHCPPSARLNEKVPDESSAYALEGSEAHALCEYKLKTALGKKAKEMCIRDRQLAVMAISVPCFSVPIFGSKGLVY